MTRLMAVLPTQNSGPQLPEARLPEVSPIVRAQFAEPYVKGLADALRDGDPESLAELASRTTDTLCASEVSENQTILLAQLGKHLPSVITSKAVDCFLRNAKGKEDMNLWAMLDAWRENGQERLPAIDELERTATDPRTRQRFLSPEQESQQRIEEAEQAQTATNAPRREAGPMRVLGAARQPAVPD
ncbi:MAG: hypothetical protein QM784_37085 [Polyangiaceae bacterium]